MLEPYFDSYTGNEEDEILMTSLITPMLDRMAILSANSALTSALRIFRRLSAKPQFSAQVTEFFFLITASA